MIALHAEHKVVGITENGQYQTDAVQSAFTKACEYIAPMWGLESFVAVNPFWGFRSGTFYQAVEKIQACAGADVLQSREYFANALREGRFNREDLGYALQTSSILTGMLSSKWDQDTEENFIDETMVWLTAPTSSEDSIFELPSILEAIDRCFGEDWNRRVTSEIGKFCALYFDRGQAVWGGVSQQEDLYRFWTEFSTTDRTLDFASGKKVSANCAKLPLNYYEVVLRTANLVGLDTLQLEMYFSRELFSIKGWAAYIQHLSFEAAKDGKNRMFVEKVLAIRLAYSLVIAENTPSLDWISFFKGRYAEWKRRTSKPCKSVLFRYLCQSALELRSLRSTLAHVKTERKNRTQLENPSKRPVLQMVFCIDVRSEVFRRHLEIQSPDIETYGFAGFFGLPLTYTPASAHSAKLQYPVLLRSQFGVSEKLRTQLATRRTVETIGGAIVKNLRQSVSAGFTFVESFGVFYAPKILSESFSGYSALKRSHRSDGSDLKIDLPLEQKISFAQSILKNSGLRPPFASSVVLCGHSASAKNNHFRAGLECGACGGNSGSINARVAAMILNDPGVRIALMFSPYEIPGDTRFLAATHITTTDEVEFPPDSGKFLSPELRIHLNQAGERTRLERQQRLGEGKKTPDAQSKLWAVRMQQAKEGAFTRSTDWSEVRPEWGLARNCAFIAGKRERTRGENLEGRVFLHEYDVNRDSDSSILELIMTAPVVVASWINLQYYGSAVAPECFGSGDKALHNVVK